MSLNVQTTRTIRKRGPPTKKRRRDLLASVPLDGGHPSSTKILVDNLPILLAGIWKDDYDSQLVATNILRRLVSSEYKPHTDGVIQLNVLPRLLKFLSGIDFPKLQYEAAWVLTNIAAENTKVIVESGAVPRFITLLGSDKKIVRELATRALGNIAGDSPEYRDLVLRHSAMTPLLSQFTKPMNLRTLRNVARTLSNFCSGKPQPSFEQTKPALPVLERLVQSKDKEVLKETCSALSYLSDGSNDRRQAVINAGIVPHLVKLVSHSSPSVLIPTLRTIGNIVSGTDEQTQTVLDHQVLPCLLNLLTNTYEKSIKKEACSTISNITAGNSNQIQAMIEAGIIQSLVCLLQNAEFEVKEEAACGISKTTSSGTHDQIKFMVSQGCIKPICDLLTCPDPRIITVCLEALENILMVGEAEKNLGHTGNNLYASMIDEAEGLEKIVKLQKHDNNEIYQRAAKILETFWTEDGEEEGNDENHAPLGFVLV